MTPALLTSTSTRPSSCRTRSAAVTRASRSVTSAAMARAPPPSSWARAVIRSMRRASSTTVCPAAASDRAVAAPMPEEAPVTTATPAWVVLSVMVFSRGRIVGAAQSDDRRPRWGGNSTRSGGLVGVLGEHALGNGCCGHGLGPAGVEGEVDDGLDQLGLAQAVLLGQAQVADELLSAAGGHKRGDRDQGPVTASELGTRPDVTEQNIVGELSELGRDVADEALRGAGLGGRAHRAPIRRRGVNSEGRSGGRACRSPQSRGRTRSVVSSTSGPVTAPTGAGP